jgi:hypothetical protein
MSSGAIFLSVKYNISLISDILVISMLSRSDHFMKKLLPNNGSGGNPRRPTVSFNNSTVEDSHFKYNILKIIWICTLWSFLYSISLMELSPSWEVDNCAATQEHPAFYGTRRFITVFTRALHWSLSWDFLLYINVIIKFRLAVADILVASQRSEPIRV